ncbi:hypothetical protein HYH03_001761 [Edaphochlamys debaryana]|uniref:RAP domain-containing protein n=1 Tax=Edaphochlamys debaryana TaxID=47281 RepID=A0A835YKD1_9CHLO|nr:hypothetical protein HYH03_001761 [Edaphochlamys debaryana]|eukprot:KAG2500180.1 hypothetical protein HYH03_001761 [Edaphochlamys debaryana]
MPPPFATSPAWPPTHRGHDAFDTFLLLPYQEPCLSPPDTARKQLGASRAEASAPVQPEPLDMHGAAGAPAAAANVPGAAAGVGPLAAAAGGVRGLATGTPSVSRGGVAHGEVRARLRAAQGLDQLWDLMKGLKPSLRPSDYALGVRLAGQLLRRGRQQASQAPAPPPMTLNQFQVRELSRARASATGGLGGPAPECYSPSKEVDRLRKLAGELVQRWGERALRGDGLDLQAAVDLLTGWSVGWFRAPVPSHLAAVLDALVPGASAAVPPRPEDPSAAGPSRYQAQGQAQAQRPRLGRLHTATLRHVAVLLPPLAALDALSPPLLDVARDLALRRAHRSTAAELAAAAAAFADAGVTDGAVARELLAALLDLHAETWSGGAGGRQRDLGRGDDVIAGDLAAALRLAAAAEVCDVGLLTAAAEALLALGLESLSEADVAAVVRAYGLAGHRHGMLWDALSACVKASRAAAGDGSAGDAAAAASSAAAAAWVGAAARDDVPDGLRLLPVTADLRTVAHLSQGFGCIQWEDPELWEHLDAAACRHLGQPEEWTKSTNSRPAGWRRRRQDFQVTAAAVAALTEGLAAAGREAPQLLARLLAVAPRLTKHMEGPDVARFAAALASLRQSDPGLLSELDRRAADLVGEAASQAPPLVGEGAAGAVAAWLPGFADAACRQLSHPCRHLTAALVGPVGTRGAASGDAAAADGAGTAPDGALLRCLLNSATPGQVCTLMGALACAGPLSGPGPGNRLLPSLAAALAAALERSPEAAPRPSRAAAAAAPAVSTAGGRRERALAALSDEEVVHVFRAVLVAGEDACKDALQEALTAAEVARLLARASQAWHASGLGSAWPQAGEKRGRSGRDGGSAGVFAKAAKALVSKHGKKGKGSQPAGMASLAEKLEALGLPVFGECRTDDGNFVVGAGVGVAGAMVGVELLPDSAFAAPAPAPGPVRTPLPRLPLPPHLPPSAVRRRDASATSEGGGGPVPWPAQWPAPQPSRRLVGDAAFRARCLEARGWRLAAVSMGEWQEAQARGGASACVGLLDQRIALAWAEGDGAAQEAGAGGA